jgi:hypothetical protein
MRIFWKYLIFWLVLKLEISYNRVIIYLEGFWFLLQDFFFKDYIFAWWNIIWVFIILLFALRYFFNVNGKATMWNTPCLFTFGAWVFLCFCMGVANLGRGCMGGVLSDSLDQLCITIIPLWMLLLPFDHNLSLVGWMTQGL